MNGAWVGTVLLGGVAALDATPVAQTLLSQPLVTATVLGLMWGDLPTALSVGVVLQILAASTLPVGSRTPEDYATGGVVGTGVALALGAHAPFEYLRQSAMLVGTFAGVEIKHTPYRSTVPGFNDLLGGQIASFCGPIGDYIPHVKAGKLRVLAISGKARSPFLPDSPTLREIGYPITVQEWYGFFLPGKTPSALVRRASEALQRALAAPDLVEAGKGFGLEIRGSSSAALAELLKADADECRRLIKQIGFTAES